MVTSSLEVAAYVTIMHATSPTPGSRQVLRDASPSDWSSTAPIVGRSVADKTGSSATFLCRRTRLFIILFCILGWCRIAVSHNRICGSAGFCLG
jgi:hypothetical protein